MGYVYHGNYAKYIHISRTSLLRKIGINDKILESQNIIMPVIEMSINYIKPVFYDDLIKIRTTLSEISGIKLHFQHLVYNPKNELINKATSTLVFVDSKKRKPMKIPGDFLKILQKNNERNY
jgi:acyl-CoA thioester hydrolase